MEREKIKNVYFEELDSTNNWLKLNLQEIPEGGVLWVTAASQTAGRGQHGRKWVSEKGMGLWTSFAYWTPENSTIPVSLEIAKTLLPLFEKLHLSATVKPPNDILIKGKKICGILCETAWEGERQATIVGIGINVAGSPQGLDQETTSLQEEGVMITAEELLTLVQEAVR